LFPVGILSVTTLSLLLAPVSSLGCSLVVGFSSTTSLVVSLDSPLGWLWCLCALSVVQLDPSALCLPLLCASIPSSLCGSQGFNFFGEKDFSGTCFSAVVCVFLLCAAQSPSAPSVIVPVQFWLAWVFSIFLEVLESLVSAQSVGCLLRAVCVCGLHLCCSVALSISSQYQSSASSQLPCSPPHGFERFNSFGREWFE